MKTGIGFDIHRLARGRRLILGGVPIKHPLGLAGHSDADALCHALADALLGAVADGDIGVHFPDSAARWKDASSLVLLKRVRARLKARRARLLHVDAVLMAEAPRIAPYRAAMRVRLARALELPVKSVSIKATTMEGIGFLGQGKGIAALAVATVAVPTGNASLKGARGRARSSSLRSQEALLRRSRPERATDGPAEAG
ncbi:MAG: 2-C-methyl-D-erythritol 2,4-cyclodiphosphate synthase [Lentisphaerae bacterium]|nr:2-C-methyl-D-erythritol 2,4-cyclodiphosphate synthase [Lentisphaerota bacterium]